MRRRQALGGAVLAVLLAAAVLGMVRAGQPAPRQDPVRSVAVGLRCPSCQGESVADSRSPIAAGMRQVVADQLARGRDPDDIRLWFVQRYGEEVLADPPVRGSGLLLWVVPALALVGAGYAAVRTLRPRARAAPAPAPAEPAPSDAAARRAWRAGSLGLVAVVVAVAVAAAGVRDGSTEGGEPPDPAAVAVLLARDMEQQSRFDAAAELYRQALRTRPDDGVRLRLGFALVRAGDTAGAEREARQVLARVPDSPDALLVLGLAQRQSDRAQAEVTLRRFLTAAPDHPAAAEIRRLLP
ncbi:cytochrome c-type biogenesis protein CcmH [Micromonospora sp. NPDC047620]|uniref:cytochrome c-type biogenesis protein CcmH n=1 Tax=Micromonospora sp. NPDC047620 TaxID=3364251 RepID=UPI0037175F72